MSVMAAQNASATVAAAPASIQLQLTRPPRTKDELWWVVGAMWGVWLPRQKVCEDHQAPFDAFSDAYFGNHANWALWYGSRGTGKSYMLAILALTKAALLEVQVVLLGGSMAQSLNVQEHVTNLMLAPNAPRNIVTGEKQTELEFMPGSWIRPLPASQKTVRGPHPHLTLLDEIDEMEKKVYDAAMGQALEKPNARGEIVSEMVVASSTWQNPVGTFQEVFDDARLKGMPVFTWCWREVIAPHGWMSADFIERKRASVPAEMFRVEYELGEPAGDARAFDLTKVKEFSVRMTPQWETHKAYYDEWIYEHPEPAGEYAIGADWAQKVDKTVITVIRIDEFPRRVVYTCRLNRRSWQEMIGKYNTIMQRYNARGAHDATGLGNVVADYIDSRSLNVELVDKKRTELLTEYIVDFEHGYYRLPLNPPINENAPWMSPMVEAHKATTVDAVWAGAAKKVHLPDDVASMAIAHRAAERGAAPAGPAEVRKDGQGPRSLDPLKPDDSEEAWQEWRARQDEDFGTGGVNVGGVYLPETTNDLARRYSKPAEDEAPLNF